jgi:hypothetical protein
VADPDGGSGTPLDWVRDRLRNGILVDGQDIDASLIEELAKNDDQAIMVPIRLKNLAIRGRLSLRHVQFRREVEFVGVTFDDAPDFSFAAFHRGALFDRSKFSLGESGTPVNFRASEIQGDLQFLNTKFNAPVTFAEMAVQRQVRVNKSTFLTATFVNAEIGGDCSIFDSSFEIVDFTGLTTLKSLQLRGVKFSGVSEIRMLYMTVQGDAKFESTRFGSDVTFQYARFGLDFILDSVEFSTVGSGHAQVTLVGMRVQGDFYYRIGDSTPRAKCKAQWNMSGAFVRGNLYIKGVRFCQRAIFDASTIEGEADFSPHDKDKFALQRTIFFRGASFQNIKFGSGGVFDQVCFAAVPGPDVEDLFTTFRGAKFGPTVRFQNTVFRGDVHFSGASVDVVADFTEARFHGKLVLQDVRTYLLRFSEDSSSSPVAGSSSTRSAHLPRSAQFERGSSVDLRGLEYKRFVGDDRTIVGKQAPHDRQPYSQLESYLRGSGRDSDADALYRARRNKEFRERFVGSRSHVVRFVGSIPAFVGDGLHWLLAGYGTSTNVVLTWVLVALGIGTCVFSREGAMAPQDETIVLVERGADGTIARIEDARAITSVHSTGGDTTRSDRSDGASPSSGGDGCQGFRQALGMSIRYFLLVDVRAAHDCQPTSKSVLGPLTANGYATAQRLFGLALATFVVAAVAGYLRRRSPST